MVQNRIRIGPFCECGALWHDGDCDKPYSHHIVVLENGFSIEIEGYKVSFSINPVVKYKVGYSSEVNKPLSTPTEPKILTMYDLDKSQT
jgi:hypothetical protein